MHTLILCAWVKTTPHTHTHTYTANPTVGGGIYSDINLHSINQDNFLFSAFFHTSCISIFILSDSTFENEFESFTVSVSPRVPDPELIHVVNASAEVIIRDLDRKSLHPTPSATQRISAHASSVTLIIYSSFYNVMLATAVVLSCDIIVINF